MQVTAQKLFDHLVHSSRFVGQKGQITFYLKGIPVNIESRDSVGNMLQEWLKVWMSSQKIDFRLPPSSQDFPDFLLSHDDRSGLLEVKSFDYEKSANFDVAAFLAYRRSLLVHPYRLDSDYMIICYSMNGSEIEIRDVWLKKIWEITGPSASYPLKCQVKQGEIFNIRPVKWWANERTKFKSFESALEFVEAFDQTQRQWTKTARDADSSTWLVKVKQGYLKTTGQPLS